VLHVLLSNFSKLWQNFWYPEVY